VLLVRFSIRIRKYILFFTAAFSRELKLSCWTLNETPLFHIVPIDHNQFTFHLSRRSLTSELQASLLNDLKTDVHVGSST